MKDDDSIMHCSKKYEQGTSCELSAWRQAMKGNDARSLSSSAAELKSCKLCISE